MIIFLTNLIETDAPSVIQFLSLNGKRKKKETQDNFISTSKTLLFPSLCHKLMIDFIVEIIETIDESR